MIESLNAAIAADSSIGSELFETLIEQQRSSGLVYGSRPICPFLRPHFLARRQYSDIVRAAEVIAQSMEAMVSAALGDGEIVHILGLTDRELRMARIDPGYRTLCVNSRLDAYLTEDAFKFFEYNAENPSGIADQMLLERILFSLRPVREALERNPHWTPKPHCRLLDALLSTYREWGGADERPNIAIVDWTGVPTASEFDVLKTYFDSEGYPTKIADPSELSYDGKTLSAGSFKIDILYKRLIIHEFLESCDEGHPLARAYEDQKLCMANSFRVKAAHKKAAFAILTDARYRSLFTEEQLNCIDQRLPWTRRVLEGTVTFENGERDMRTLLRKEKERLVLKPNDDYGGAGIVMGWEARAEEWETAIRVAFDKPYIVQERISPTRTIMPSYDRRLHFDEMLVDFDPFLFLNRVEGGLVRLSSSSVSNISAGGGETALVVLEDIR